MHSTVLRSALRCAGILLACGAARADTLYATSSAVNPFLMTIDVPTNTVLSSLEISGEEALFGGLCDDGVTLYSIDGYSDGISDRTLRIFPSSANGMVVGDTTFDWSFRSCDVERLTLVTYATSDAALYRIDASGTAILVASLAAPGLDQVTALAISSAGEAFVTDIGGASLFRLDLATGGLSFVGDTLVGNHFNDLAFDSQGRLWGVRAQGGLYRIDTSTAAPTLVMNSGDWAGIAFRWDGQPTFYCTSKVNSMGCAAGIAAAGASSASASSGFEVRGVHVLNQKPGLLLYGTTGRAGTPFQGGFLCIAPPVRRSFPLNSGGTPLPSSDCFGKYEVDMNAFAAGALGGNPLPALAVAGTVVDCQFWGRDPGLPAPNSSTLTNALEYVVGP